MKITGFFQKTLTTSAGIALGLVSFASMCLPALSQGGFEWWQTADRGNPAERVAGGNRTDPNSQCQVEAPLTALVPAYGVQSITRESRTLWLYFPYSPGAKVERSKLVLTDTDDVIVYEGPGKLQAPNNPGIVGVEFPSSLEVDKTYKWELSVDVDCGSGSQASLKYDYVHGLVKLVELPVELKQKLESETDPLKRYKLYAEAEVWYGALTELAEIRALGRENQAVNSVWVELLDSAGWETEESRKNLEEYIIPAPVVSYSAGDAQ